MVAVAHAGLDLAAPFILQFMDLRRDKVMAMINLHFLDARGALGDHREWLRASLLDSHEKANGLLSLRPLDVIVQAGTGVIPEKGHGGYAPGPGVIYVTVDPASAVFRTNHDASLERMFAHELHHAARWDGPGYGVSLGEALISEGLAGAFAQEVYGGPPEPWERLGMDTIREHVARAERDWNRTDYAHARWFFGESDLPRWLGYSLGFQLVQRYLSEQEGRCASGLAQAEAQLFRGMLERIGDGAP